MGADLKEHGKQLVEIAQIIEQKRGEVLDIAIAIENDLTNIIAWCFYPSAKMRGAVLPEEAIDKNGIALKALLLNKISFRDKIEIIKDVILFRNPQVMETNKAFINKTIKELGKVREFRNLLAHSELDLGMYPLGTLKVSAKRLKSDFQLKEYKKGHVIRHYFDKAKYENEVKVMLRVRLKLWLLLGLFSDDVEYVKKTKKQIDKL